MRKLAKALSLHPHDETSLKDQGRKGLQNAP